MIARDASLPIPQSVGYKKRIYVIWKIALRLSACAIAIFASFVSIVLAAELLLEPVVIDTSVLSSSLEHLGYRDYPSNVRRNSSGSRLYTYQWRQGGLGVLVIEHGRVVQRLTRPADTAYLNDQGQFVAWSNDLKVGVNFRGSTQSTLSRLRWFGVDPGGRYFFASAAVGRVDIGNVANPQQILAYSKLSFPQAIFAGDKKLYLVGHGSEGRSAITCETYEFRSDRASLTDTRTIQDASVVLDMADERLMVQGSRDFLPSVRVVQLHGSADTRLGVAKNFALFLQPGALLQ
jgi:hypothetical protein